MKLLLFYLFPYIILIYGDKCTWNNCPKWDHNKINIHIIAHTHVDLGWIGTNDELYFNGPWDTSSSKSGVRDVINTIVYELNKNITRKFSFMEIGHLKRWMDEYGEYGYTTMKNLVQSGRLELIGGGWVMADEATSHYIELIDMYSLSLTFLNKTFGKCGHPKVGWQIDPFGHSKEHANLLRMMGYEYLFLCREHFQEHKMRRHKKSLTMLWHVSEDNKKTLLTEQHWNYNHQGPYGFCMESPHTMNCKDAPIIENEKQGKVNVDHKLRMFMKYIKKRMKVQNHNHVLVLLGDDYAYSVPDSYFTNIDKLIYHMNRNFSDKIITFYSTPSCYLQAFSEVKDLEFADKFDDFFPYALNGPGYVGTAYWSGYFTSRPGIKGLIRKTSSLLQLARKLNALALDYNNESRDQIEELERAIALTVSHDGITGTSFEKVTQDFIYNLAKSWASAEKVLNSAMQKISNFKNNDTAFPKQNICRRLNESECETTRLNRNFFVTLHNSNSQKLHAFVKIPIYHNITKIEDGAGKEIEFQIIPVFDNDNQLNNTNMAKNEICFIADVDPLGYHTYFLKTHQNNSAIFNKTEYDYKNDDNYISNELIRLDFDSLGMLNKFHDLTTNETYSLTQELLYYRGRSMDNKVFWGDQPSGAYILHPLNEIRFNKKIELRIIKGKIINEARQIITPWISQVIRLLPNKKLVEFEWTIGPIPQWFNNPKDVITRYTINDLKSNGVFWTDSNGRQMIKRIRNYNKYFTYNNTEPIAGNYYPITSKAMISDGKTSMVILTDRAQGCTSLVNGQLEIMIHRRSFYDDMVGNFESLNETGHDGRGLVVRGKHWLIVGDTRDATNLQRTLAYEKFHSYWMTFSKADSHKEYRKKFVTKFSGLKKPLPPNVNLLTLKQIDSDLILIRLEHIFQSKEHPDMSKKAIVDLEDLISGFKIISIKELSLAANNILSISKDTKIMLKPMEIKAYELKVRITVNITEDPKRSQLYHFHPILKQNFEMFTKDLDIFSIIYLFIVTIIIIFIWKFKYVYRALANFGITLYSLKLYIRLKLFLNKSHAS